MAQDFGEPRHPLAYFSPTDGYYVATPGQGEQLLRVTGRRTITDNQLPDDAYSLIPDTDDFEPHQVVQSDRWVAVQFGDRGPIYVLHDDGTVTERHTMPCGDRGVAHTARGAA